MPTTCLVGRSSKATCRAVTPIVVGAEFVTISGRWPIIIAPRCEPRSEERTAGSPEGLTNEPSSRQAVMKARTAFRLAWSVWLATVAFLAGAVVLAISRHAPLGLIDLSLILSSGDLRPSER
jgi:hypothetical protein